MKYPRATSKRTLQAKIKRGERLLNGEAIRATEFGLGEIYRVVSGDIALRAFEPHAPQPDK
jgi:hypothetical protein